MLLWHVLALLHVSYVQFSTKFSGCNPPKARVECTDFFGRDAILSRTCTHASDESTCNKTDSGHCVLLRRAMMAWWQHLFAKAGGHYCLSCLHVLISNADVQHHGCLVLVKIAGLVEPGDPASDLGWWRRGCGAGCSACVSHAGIRQCATSPVWLLKN